MKKKGKVFIVGVGPGDQGLLTIKALECINEADVIVYDHLIPEDVLGKVKGNAKLIYAGKLPKKHTLEQDNINKTLVRYAKKGNIVARIKGGDPFIFGRGAEECLALAENKIDFEVIPGINSAIAAAAYSGIALTCRKISSQVTFVTGHEDPKKIKSDIDWSLLARTKGTIVIFMGMRRLKNIVYELLASGMNRNTSVCIVQWATFPKQKSVTAKLSNIVAKVKKEKLSSPAVIIIGEVVNLKKKLSWYEKKPLHAKKILITRALSKAKEFRLKLEKLGAEVYSYPMIEILEEKIDKKKLIKNITESDWVVFTSKSAVEICFAKLNEISRDARLFSSAKIAVLGKQTKDALRKHGINADIIPKKFYMESLLYEFKRLNIKNKKVFIPHSKRGRKVLEEGLASMQAVVNSMYIYDVKRPKQAKAGQLKKIIKEKNFDFITFTSASCVHEVMGLMKGQRSLMKKQRFACIGPITEKALKNYGFSSKATAKEFTIDGLTDAMIEKIKR